MSIPNPVLNLDLSVDTATGSTTARTLADRAADVVNVLDFVAVDASDYTTGVQAALNAVPTSGGVVFFPKLCPISATVFVKSNTHLQGAGPGTGLLAIAGFSGGPLLTNVNSAATSLTDHDISAEDMLFDYGAFPANGGAHAFQMIFVRNVRVSGCTFQVRGSGNATAMLGCANTLVSGCFAYGFTNCAFDHWWGPQNGRVIGCYAETATAGQMVNWNPEATSGPSTGLSADGFVLADNEFVATGASAIAMQLEPLGAGTTASNITVTGNVFKNCILAMRGAVRGMTILGNNFVAPLGGNAAIFSYGQNGGSPADLVISDNNIVDPTTTAGNLAVIRIGTASAIICGNRISGSGYYYGIDTATYAATVSNNSISNGLQNTPNALPGVALHLGSVNAASVTDLSKHIDMWGGVIGLNITTSRMNFVLPTGNSAIFVSNGADVASVSSTGLNGAVIGATTPAAASVTQLNLTTSAGPNVRSGAGAASGTQPKGSIWMRTDGGVGTTMYVSQGAGVWNAVAAV